MAMMVAAPSKLLDNPQRNNQDRMYNDKQHDNDNQSLASQTTVVASNVSVKFQRTPGRRSRTKHFATTMTTMDSETAVATILEAIECHSRQTWAAEIFLALIGLTSRSQYYGFVDHLLDYHLLTVKEKSLLHYAVVCLEGLPIDTTAEFETTIRDRFNLPNPSVQDEDGNINNGQEDGSVSGENQVNQTVLNPDRDVDNGQVEDDGNHPNQLVEDEDATVASRTLPRLIDQLNKKAQSLYIYTLRGLGHQGQMLFLEGLLVICESVDSTNIVAKSKLFNGIWVLLERAGKNQLDSPERHLANQVYLSVLAQVGEDRSAEENSTVADERSFITEAINSRFEHGSDTGAGTESSSSGGNTFISSLTHSQSGDQSEPGSASTGVGSNSKTRL